MPEEIGQETSFERASSERAPDTTDDRDLLYLGIDLGTANSSVATGTGLTLKIRTPSIRLRPPTAEVNAFRLALPAVPAT